MLGGSCDYTSCPDCGTSVRLESLAKDLHCCDGLQRIAHIIRLALAEEVDLFEHGWQSYLDSPHGRFEVFYAARARRYAESSSSSSTESTASGCHVSHSSR
jgi:hypothetical protein